VREGTKLAQPAALVSKAAELLGVLLVLPLALPHRIGRLSVSAA